MFLFFLTLYTQEIDQEEGLKNFVFGCNYISSTELTITKLDPKTKHSTILHVPPKFIKKSTEYAPVAISNFGMSETFLHELYLPSTIRQLGDGAFAMNYNLTKIDLSITKITYIPVNCFAKCYSLKEILIPNSILSIGRGAFSYCYSLEEFDLVGTNVTYIGDYAFFDCHSLKKIALPSNIVDILDYAFAGTSLDDIKLGSEVSDIGAAAFYNSSITSIDLRNIKSTTLKNYTFCNCTQLTEVQLPSNINYILEGCFSNCTSLSSIDLSLTRITELSDFIFKSCTKLTSIILPPTVSIFGEDCLCGTGLITYTIPSTVTSFKNGCLSNCEYLTMCDFSKASITEIPKQMFYGCIQLSAVQWPTESFSIQQSAFQQCGFPELVLPANVISIDSFAFADNDHLVFVDTTLSPLNLISKGMFENCTRLTKLNITDKITTILERAFRNTGLVELIIPHHITGIGVGAFMDCKNLEVVSFAPSILSTISESMFENCIKLTKLYIGGNIINIEKNALAGCNINEMYYLGSQEIKSVSDISIETVIVTKTFPKDSLLGSPVKKLITKYSKIPGMPVVRNPLLYGIGIAATVVIVSVGFYIFKFLLRTIKPEEQERLLASHQPL